MSRLEHFYDSSDMSICVSANTTYGELKNQIKKDGLDFPLAWDEDASLLEMLKLSPITSASMNYGSWADSILGININYKGEKLSLGGRVVKNVTGFDFNRAIVLGGWSILEPVDLVLRLRPVDDSESIQLSGELDSLKSFCKTLNKSPWGLSVDVLDFIYNEKPSVVVEYHGREHERNAIATHLKSLAIQFEIESKEIQYKFPFKYADHLTVLHTTISQTHDWCRKLHEEVGGEGVIHYSNGTIFWKTTTEVSEEKLIEWTKQLQSEGGFACSKNFSPPVRDDLLKTHKKYLEQLELTHE